MLNRLVSRDGAWVSPRTARDFVMFPEVAEAVRAFRDLGMLVFVVSNQPDIARGHLASDELDRMTRILQQTLGADEVAVCPHEDADDCLCRKPRPGLILTLAERWNADLARSYVIGDSWRDVQAGRSAGCHTILIERQTPAGIDADARVRTLVEAAGYIADHQPGPG